MMAIKEMQKLYKKIVKAENNYDTARWSLEDRHDFTDVEWYLEKAQQLHKACRALKKIADNMTTTMGLLMLNTGNEDEFIRWMIVNDIDIIEKVEDEEEEKEEA